MNHLTMASTCMPLLVVALSIVLWAPLALSVFVDDAAVMSAMYQEWMAQHGRVYTDAAEAEKRFNIYRENVIFIESFNAQNHSYKMSVNEFADQSVEEFVSYSLGYNGLYTKRLVPLLNYMYLDSQDVPESMDWRKLGAVTPVKNQLGCQCCWAFSAVASIEGITNRKAGRLISLSEQELVDCDKNDGGCNGGWMRVAFEYVKQSGLAGEDDYPYTGTNKMCNLNKAKDDPFFISGFQAVPQENETALLYAVAGQPVSVAIDASPEFFRFYSSGVFTGPCGTQLNHGVTIVGYGTTENGEEYWLVKNSWGPAWGDKGYVKMKRGAGNPEGICGITLDASFPTA